MSAVINKIRKIRTILKSRDVILITVDNDNIVVDASDQSPDVVKNVATRFFRQAYKIK